MAKAGRPKNLRPHEIRLHVPMDSDAMLKNKAKRIYWALQEYEKKMARDITSVKMKDYLDLLDGYQEVCNALRAKGYIGRYAKKRVDNTGLDKDGNESGTREAGGKGSVGLGSGVPPFNPLA